MLFPSPNRTFMYHKQEINLTMYQPFVNIQKHSFPLVNHIELFQQNSNYIIMTYHHEMFLNIFDKFKKTGV